MLTKVSSAIHPVQNPEGNSVIVLFVFQGNSCSRIGGFCRCPQIDPHDKYAHEQHDQHVTDEQEPGHLEYPDVFNGGPQCLH